jgi:hypothetical protein
MDGSIIGIAYRCTPALSAAHMVIDFRTYLYVYVQWYARYTWPYLGRGFGLGQKKKSPYLNTHA